MYSIIMTWREENDPRNDWRVHSIKGGYIFHTIEEARLEAENQLSQGAVDVAIYKHKTGNLIERLNNVTNINT